MTFDVNRYRGFELNVEMHGGRFVPSYHDSLDARHAGDRWARMPEAADASKDKAFAKAKDALDKKVLSEIAHTIGQMHDAGVKVEI